MRRSLSSAALKITLLLGGCSAGPSTPDASTPDALMLDAPMLDVRLLDAASGDAPAIDASFDASSDAGSECSLASDCDDDDECTFDDCASGTCIHAPIDDCEHGCDIDGDGFDGDHCLPIGDDCDDFDGAVHPGATERCDDGVDNDCDGRADRTDDACAPANATCATATPRTGSFTALGTTIDPETPRACGGSAFWTLTLTERSDVALTLTMHEPASSGISTIAYGLALERVCGDVTSTVDRPFACLSWTPRLVGSPIDARDVRRLPPGTYTIEVQAGSVGSPEIEATDFDLVVDVSASDAPECPGAALASGSVISADTSGHADAFAFSCRGNPVRAAEAVYELRLAERRRVRVAVDGAPIAGSEFSSGMRVSLPTSCDPSAPSECVERDSARTTCEASTVLERILEAGDHTLVIENTRAGSTGYTLHYDAEAVGAACAGAAVLVGTGLVSGTTTGDVDRFRWNEAGCGAGAGPDHVYALDLAVRSHVTLALPVFFDGAFLQVVRACGEALVAGDGRSRSLDVMLDAGSYHVVIGGGRATEDGAFTLSYGID